MRNHRTLQAVTLAGALVAAALASGVGGATLGPLASGGSLSTSPSSCDHRPVHDTARLQDDGGAGPAIVEAGSELNGTGGSIWFTGEVLGEAGEDPVRLRGPGGVETDARRPLGQEVLFHVVPLCQTGTWRLVDDTGENLSTFQTTLDPSQTGPGTILLDQPADTNADDRYQAGGADGTSTYYTGENVHESGDVGETRTVQVSVNWTSEIGASDATDRALLTILAEGDDGDHVTTLELPDFGNGTLSVYPNWSTPSAHDVEVAAWAYDDGEIRERSPARATVVVAPETPSSPLGSPASPLGVVGGTSPLVGQAP